MRRRIAAFTAVGAMAAFFVGIQPRLWVIGEGAAAQPPAPLLITVTSRPNTNINDDPWHRFQLSVPPTSPPLDMHVAFLIDGKGEETVIQEPRALSEPLPFKYRLDTDDDSRVKGILEAQGFPVKKNLVTYRFGAGTFNTVEYNQTIRFRHRPGGQQLAMGHNDIMQAAVGKKIILENRLLCDEDFKGDLDKVTTLDQQLRPGFAPKTALGMVHHLAVYLMFTPHQGPPVTQPHSITHRI